MYIDFCSASSRCSPLEFTRNSSLNLALSTTPVLKQFAKHALTGRTTSLLFNFNRTTAQSAWFKHRKYRIWSKPCLKTLKRGTFLPRKMTIESSEFLKTCYYACVNISTKAHDRLNLYSPRLSEG